MYEASELLAIVPGLTVAAGLLESRLNSGHNGRVRSKSTQQFLIDSSTAEIIFPVASVRIIDLGSRRLSNRFWKRERCFHEAVRSSFAGARKEISYFERYLHLSAE